MVQNDKALLARLRNEQVEFVIIGGGCGILHGVTLLTTDLHVCCRFTAQNLYRIQNAVKDLHPYHRLVANQLPLELTDELCSRLNSAFSLCVFARLALNSRHENCSGILGRTGHFRDPLLDQGNV
jgi:hypothetical protein